MQPSDADANIVKLLRQKCTKLEDQLDTASEGKKAAILVKAHLEADLVRLQQELRAQRQAGELAKVTAGRGREVVEHLQSSVREQDAAMATLRGRCEEEERSAGRLREELHEGRGSLRRLQDQVSQADDDLLSVKNTAAQQEESETRHTALARKSEQECAASVAWAEKQLKSTQEECLRLRAQSSTMLERIQGLESETRSVEKDRVRVADMERDLIEREAAFTKLNDERVGKLQATLQEMQAKTSRMQQEAVTFEAARQDLETNLCHLQASRDESQEQLTKAENELLVAISTAEKSKKGIAKAEAELVVKRRSIKDLQEQFECTLSDRDCVLERMAEADRDKGAWEAKLSEAGDNLKAMEARLVSKLEEQAGPLRAALAKEQSERERFRCIHNDLEHLHINLHTQLCEGMGTTSALQDTLSRVKEAMEAAKAAHEDEAKHAALVESELEEERRLLKEVQKECSQLAPDRDSLLRRLDEAGRAREDGRREATVLAERLEAELRSRVAEAELYHELRHKHDGHLRAREAAGLRAESLLGELELERKAREADEDSSTELQQQHEALLSEKEREQRRADELAGEVQEERRQLAADAALHEEFRSSYDKLRLSKELAREKVAKLTEETASERRLRAADLAALAGLRERRGVLAAARLAAEGLGVGATARLAEATEAHSEERQRKGELQERLDAVQPEHEDLFTRYSGAVEQIDILKTEIKKAARERDSLRRALEERREEECARKEQEEVQTPRPPPPLAVSDVLISVVFEGASSALELRPWDTDLEGVVSAWLAAERQAPGLQPGLVRYLRRLEESAEAFPVFAEASLREVQEQFAAGR